MTYPGKGLLLALTPIACLAHVPGVAGEVAPAGDQARMAFAQPVAGLQGEQRLDFMVGRGLFRRLWVTGPASTQAADGLGPLYNARGCMSCHVDGGRGRLTEGADDDAVSLVMRIDIPPQDEDQRRQLAEHRVNNIPDPTYGLQLQTFAVPGHAAEYRLGRRYTEIPLSLAAGGHVDLRQPRYSVDDLGYGPLHPQARLSPRLAPQLIGLGLLEAIDEKDIIAREDPDDRDGDGISGRANRVWNRAAGAVTLGRFGHKAGLPSIDEQSQAAFSIDLGLSVPLYPDAAGDCTERQPDCRSAPNGSSVQYDDLEAHRQLTDLVSFYVSHLAVPARRNADHPDVLAGERIFGRIGCQSCHTPYFRTGSRTGDAANHHRDIAPYTDLLLHDLGEGLADNRPEGVADGHEWRTAPLWGIGLTPQLSGHGSYLHDGRARSVLEAILWHGGEARAQRDAVIALDPGARNQLLTFIESL